MQFQFYDGYLICNEFALNFSNLMKQTMNLYLKSLVSKFKPCVVLCKVHWLYLDGAVGKKCQKCVSCVDDNFVRIVDRLC